MIFKKKFVTEVACWWNIICTHLSNVCFCFLFTNKMQTFIVTVLFHLLKLFFIYIITRFIGSGLSKMMTQSCL